jgi:D-beta-D-heptose 7-phosphate kinase/D-beta-D-heptose 1-phosphate adenosyltransferase
LENLTRASARAFLASFQGKHVVVVGDVMLDEYVRGDAARISPEAPVPVVDLTERLLMPGGAANAAANIVSLGAKATIVGIVGADLQAEQLRTAMTERGIGADALVTTKDRPTTHKLRIVARTQQIVRVDVESREKLSEDGEAKLIAQIMESSFDAQAIVISDYAKGVATDYVVKACIEAGKLHGIPLVVDPKARDFSKYAGATIITPNLLELEVAAGVSTPNTDEAIVAAGRALLERVGGAQILVTRGAAGMTLLSPGKEPLHLPTVARSVYDVTGAGDTVVGTLTLALAAKVPMVDALVLASHAASIAVGRPGTVAVTTAELLASFPPA